MKKFFIILGIIFALFIIIIISSIIWYKVQISAPNNSQNVVLEIKTGTKTADILKELEQSNVIKSDLAAIVYLKLHDIKNLQAGKYSFNGEENLEQVIDKITNGKVMDETVTITFKEGKNIRYIASTIAEKTNNTSNDVYKLLKNEDYIDSLINKYWFLTNEIKNKDIYYPLEGYLYPDTYNFENADVEVKTIFEKMLDQMGTVLAKYKKSEGETQEDENEEEKYTAHEVLTMASMVELEANSSSDRAKIASVFYNRLEKNMSLGSDVTTYYAVRTDMGERNLNQDEIDSYNAYNTRGPNMNGKLPVGPIACPSEDAISAVLNPIKGSYLYFVSDKNGTMYFMNSYEEHKQVIDSLKKKGLWYEY